MSTRQAKKYSTLLKFKLHSEDEVIPEFFVSLNGVPLNVDFDTAQGYAQFGPNKITISFTNKQHFHHHLALEIASLTIDGIDLTHDIKANGVYITDSGVTETTYGFMHKNGSITFDFLCPVFYYLRNKALVKDQEYAAYWQ